MAVTRNAIPDLRMAKSERVTKKVVRKFVRLSSQMKCLVLTVTTILYLPGPRRTGLCGISMLIST